MTETVLSSATKEVVIGFDRLFVVIGERINPRGESRGRSRRSWNLDMVIVHALYSSRPARRCST